MDNNDLKIFINIPTLKTDRLTLRKIKNQDVFDIFEYAKQEEVSKYLLWEPHPNILYTKRYISLIQKRYRRCLFYDWGIILGNKMIGTVGFTSFDLENNSAEIGYVLNKNYWGKGIAKEASSKIIEFGFEQLHLERIFAKCMTENESSKKVMKKLGMKNEGVHRKAIFAKGKYFDISIYAILNEEYNQ